MSPATKLGGFAAALSLLFAGGAVAGGAIDPDREGGSTAHATTGGHAGSDSSHSEATMKTSSHSGAAAHPVRGLAVAQDGLRVVVQTPELRRDADTTLRYRIVDEHGETVRDFDVEHERRMHLIIARRDLTGFQHLHPTQQRDGSWSVRVRIAAAGSYRLFADFTRDDESFTLASDLRVDGPADLRPLPAPRSTTVSDGGLLVRLERSRARAGRESRLRFTVLRDGEPVHTEPYLGAGGHLVALRDGDLAFLHVHPTEHGHGEKTEEHDDGVGFAATFPTRGRYRLFLQFKVDGRVHTAAFTQAVS